jgi:hypothetical protein
MARPDETGWVGRTCPDCGRPLRTVVEGGRGAWFVATRCGPCDRAQFFSRESENYPTRQAVEEALRTGTVRWRGEGPTG